MSENRFVPFPVLSSARLRLRQLREDDAEGLFALRADQQVAKYVQRPVVTSVDDIHPFIDRLNKGVADSEWVFWAVTLKGDDALIGTICFWNFADDGTKAEIGYELLPAYQGKGIMQEAVTAVLGYGFERLKLAVIEAVVHPDNVKSIKLLERNGFAAVDTLKEDEMEMVVYSITKQGD